MDKGAHYFKADLQIHSPRDVNWKCNDSPRPCTDVERKKYAEDFIKHCRVEGLRIVAITDHHDMVFVKYIQEAAYNEKDSAGNPMPFGEKIFVFPGMELTIQGGYQVLVLLDPACNQQHFTKLTGILGISEAPPDQAQGTNPTQLPIQDITQLEDSINKVEDLRGKFVLLPHVGRWSNKGPKSHGSILRNGNQLMYANMPSVGGYIEHPYEIHPQKQILCGKDEAWGKKCIGVFQTSDSREFRLIEDEVGNNVYVFPTLGNLFTWIKISEPTTEALRQACLAKDTRIIYSEPVLPNAYITKLKVTDSKYLGPIDLEFNPQLNALIGGRGTGKSTILEYIRWGLCDQIPETIEDGTAEVPDFQKKRASLIDKTLKSKNAVVEVTFVINGIQHVVQRNSSTTDIKLKIGSGELKNCTEGEIQNLLPIQAYSQKQLSNVSVRSSEIQRFILIPIQKELDKLDEALTTLGSQIKETHATLQKKRAMENESKKLLNSIESQQLQAVSLRGQLKNLTEDDQKLISQSPKYDQEKNLFKQWENEIALLLRDLSEMTEKINELPSSYCPDENSPNQDILANAYNSLQETFKQVRIELCKLSTLMENNESLKQYREFRLQWTAKQEKFTFIYAQAVDRTASNKKILDELQAVEKEVASSTDIYTERQQMLGVIGDPQEKLKSLFIEWVGIHNKKSDMLTEQCNKLNELSQGRIRAVLQKGKDTSKIAIALKDQLKGANISSKKIDDLCVCVSSTPVPVETWLRVIYELECLYSVEIDGTSFPPTPYLDSAGFQDTEKIRIAKKLTPHGLIELALTPIYDQPKFEYKSTEEQYIDFTDASAGQQATALLAVLLNQTGPTLIIDQPEDDLDNQTIQAIIELLWQAKIKRQIIVSSHNANVVVNGDAELVVWCNYKTAGDHSEGKIEAEGAIDKPVIRDAIKDVMEGGEKAFLLRKEKYGF